MNDPRVINLGSDPFAKLCFALVNKTKKDKKVAVRCTYNRELKPSTK